MTSRSCTNRGAGSPDGRALYSGGADEKVKVRDAPTGIRCTPCRDIRRVGAVSAGPGGLFASGGGDGAVRAWEKELTRKGWDGL